MTCQARTHGGTCLLLATWTQECACSSHTKTWLHHCHEKRELGGPSETNHLKGCLRCAAQERPRAEFAASRISSH